MRVTKDDERARRICSLALEFMNAKSPVPSGELARDFYPTLSPDSFRRAFSRDRMALAACGITIEEVRASGGESSWRAAEGTFLGGAELEPVEAAALDVACQPLLDDPAFPLSGDLRLALAKLTRAFAEVGAGASTQSATEESRAFGELRRSLVDGCAAQICYQDAAGRVSERTIAPYGIFELRGRCYLVAGRLDERGNVMDGGERTYRTDRVLEARELTDVPVCAPADFSPRDWRRLPFQIGAQEAEARFLVPADRAADLRHAACGQGAFDEKAGALVWSITIADLDAAARWAVALGVRPLTPAALVHAWKKLLEGVLCNAS